MASKSKAQSTPQSAEEEAQPTAEAAQAEQPQPAEEEVQPTTEATQPAEEAQSTPQSAEEEALPEPRLVRGGRYLVNGQLVNANGELLSEPAEEAQSGG